MSEGASRDAGVAAANLAGSAVAVLAGSGVAMTCGLVIRVIMARALTPEGLGALLLAVAVASFAGGVAALGLRQASARRIAALLAAGKGGAARRCGRTAMATGVVGGAVATVGVMVAPALLGGRWAELPSSLLAAVAPSALGLAVGVTMWGISQGHHDTLGRALIRDSGGSVLRLVGATVAAFVAPRPAVVALGWMLGGLLGELSLVAYGTSRGWLQGGARGCDRELLRELPPYTGISVINQARRWLDLLVVGLLAPLAVVGIYGVAQSVARVIVMVANATAHRFLPAATAAWASDDEGGLALLYARARALTYSFLWVPLAICLLCPDELVTVAFGAAYAAAAPPLRIVALGLMAPALLGYYDQVLVARRRPAGVVVVGLLGLTATVGLMLVLVAPYGAVGAAVAVTVGILVRDLSGFALVGAQVWRVALAPRALLPLAAASLPALITVPVAHHLELGALPTLLLAALAAAPAAARHGLSALRASGAH